MRNSGLADRSLSSMNLESDWSSSDNFEYYWFPPMTHTEFDDSYSYVCILFIHQI